MGRGSDFLGQTGKRHRTSHSLKIAFGPELGADRDYVHRHMLVDKLVHGLENHSVTRVIETRDSKLLKRRVNG